MGKIIRKEHRNKKLKCKECGKTKDVAAYIIADDIEHPRLYCKQCLINLMIKVIDANPDDHA